MQDKSTDSISSNQNQTIWKKQVCPHCGEDTWVKLPRSLLQKIFHANQNLCFCRTCRQKFWRPKEI